MNVLKKCCMCSLKENRKRTAMTILGVILSAALITGVACLAESLRESMVQFTIQENGDHHYCFFGVDKENLKYFLNNRNIQKVGLAYEVGYAALEGSANPDKPYLYIRAVDEECIRSMSLKLSEGRMPEKDDELVIGRHICYNGMVDLQVGDTLTLQIGKRISDGGVLDQSDPYSDEEEVLQTDCEKTYTIVGIVERPGTNTVEGRYAPGYSVFTRLDPEDAGPGKYEVYATYTKQGLRNAYRVTAGLLGISEELFRKRYSVGLNGYTQEEYAQVTQVASAVQENVGVLRWEQIDLSDSTMTMLYGMAALAVVIIILTSVFCIRNSFAISLTEKMKLYGRLASVGTTPKQQRKMVYYEALFLGAVGIPAGILCGILASVILVRLVSGLMETATDIPLIFSVSVPAILVVVVLSAVTILLSAMQSAWRAAKISPISAIRANSSVKISRKEIKCPRFIGKIFGIGGRIAYRNLRRARRRYRTTVISIVSCVAVFIGLSTFVQLLGMASKLYYDNIRCQIRVNLYQSADTGYEEAKKIAQLEGIQQAEILRSVYQVQTDSSSVPFAERYRRDHADDFSSGEYQGYPLAIVSLGEKGYADYCQSLGIDAKESRDKAIVLADYESTDVRGGKSYVDREVIAQFQKGDVIEITNISDSEGVSAPGDLQTELEVFAQTDVRPMSLSADQFNRVVLIVSDSWLDSSPFAAAVNDYIQVSIRCDDAAGLEQAIREEGSSLTGMTVQNYENAYRSEHAMYLMISIFLYGFITVVALIGITNIFNTVTTNLELRTPEFAMLQAVGMTGKQFRHMIRLEGLFYGGKALLIGIPAGLAISVAFHMIFSEGIVTNYRPPFTAVIVSVAVVLLLLYGVMRYSMRKINRRNIVETIRNENL